MQEDEIKIETTGRKPYIKRVTFCVRIDEDVYSFINNYAEEHKISKSKAIRELITQGVKFGN
jgi:predicted HicB family RNase H-like nuclease